MYRIAVCEDDPIHAKMIDEKIREVLGESSEVTVFSNPDDVIRSVKMNGVEYAVVVTDIDLGEKTISGIEMSKKINLVSPNTKIIFVTQYVEDFVSDVYETSHVYYISKKKINEYLKPALNKAFQKIHEQEKQNLIWKRGRQTFCVAVSSICYLERIMRSTEIHTTNEIYQIEDKFTELQNKLNEDFQIVHRSYMVNMRYISIMTRNELKMINGERIPVGRTHYEELKKAYARMLYRG